MLKPILLVDDHPLFRAALRQAVEGAAPDREIQEATSLNEARVRIKDDPPGLLCLDLHMEDSDGFAGLIEIRRDMPTVPVAIVSGSEEAGIATRALAFGASAFIPKSLDIPEIKAAVTAVLDGNTWLPPGTEESMDSDAKAGVELAERLASLTPAQLKVLQNVKAGLLNKQIAYEMSISEATVKAHMTAILRKLNVQTRTQAVIAASALTPEQPEL
ncbi:MAG: response regulator transcription factor, partial [Pseudomonadota bacterium]